MRLRTSPGSSKNLKGMVLARRSSTGECNGRKRDVRNVSVVVGMITSKRYSIRMDPMRKGREEDSEKVGVKIQMI